MNQKSSLREVPRFVSGVLTGNNEDEFVAGKFREGKVKKEWGIALVDKSRPVFGKEI